MNKHLFHIGAVVLLLAFVMASVVYAASHGMDPSSKLDCTECHECATPTLTDNCLKACPRHLMTHQTTEHSLTEAPDTIMLGQLADQYRPVRFDHKAHANMAEMGLNCASCHHYSPPGRVPGCRECHEGEGDPTDLAKPGLKGAYHRQCISCHREWSHDTKCVLCHVPADGTVQATGAHADPTDIMGISHPVIEEPAKRVYHTNYDDGPVVTFYHKEHIELYGLSCAGCHQGENCGTCHDLRLAAQPELRKQRTFEEIHSTCERCHGDDACSKCHQGKERPPFSHATTGWPLNKYHVGLACRACHPTGKMIARLNSSCDACHSGWHAGNFDHTKVGLRLDEIHAEADCGDCHAERAFDKKPDCSGCHDDNRDPKQTPPGEYLLERAAR